MPISLKTFFLLLFIFIANTSNGQVLKFEELVSTFISPSYPTVFYDSIESKGFVRIDKQYPYNCERIMYYFDRKGKSVLFANPQHCKEEFRNPYYPLMAKQQIELQFQRLARPDFDKLNAEIRKSCRFISNPAGAKSINKIKGKKPGQSPPKAYHHASSGIKFVVCDLYPVSYIFLLK